MESELDEEGQVRRTVTRWKNQVISDAKLKKSLSERELVDLNRDGVLDTELVYDHLGVLRKINKLKP